LILVLACAARLLIIMALLLPSIRGQLFSIFGIAALAATCNRFFVPAASALLPGLVPAHRLPMANAVIMGVRMTGMAVGTLLAGVVVSHYGHVMAVVMVGAILLISGILCIALPAFPTRSEQTDESSQ